MPLCAAIMILSLWTVSAIAEEAVARESNATDTVNSQMLEDELDSVLDSTKASGTLDKSESNVDVSAGNGESMTILDDDLEYEIIFEEIEVDDQDDDGFVFDVTGFRKFKWKDYSSSGNSTQFESNNGLRYFDTKIEQSSQISLFGQHKKGIFIRGDFSELPYQERVLSLELETRKGKARMGDFSTKFPGEKLTQFSKNVEGFDFSYDFGDLSFETIMSKQKSATKRETFKGQNLRGPYKLKTTGIVEGSEKIRLDGGELNKTQYRIDYFRGEITFMFIVDPTQEIEVTYETELLWSARTGSVKGFGLEYQPGKKNYIIGASYQNEGTNALSRSVLEGDTITFASVTTGLPYSLGRTLINKNNIVVTNNTNGLEYLMVDSSGENYTIDYAAGNITFLNTVFSGANATVDFFYYNPELVEAMVDEKLIGQAVFDLSRRTIFAGTEHVRLYENDLFKQDLTVDDDYTINETQNTITLDSNIAGLLTADNSNYYVLIDYQYVQETGAELSEAERNVYDAYLKFRPFKNLYLETEVAQSEADLYPKTISVTEEYIATVADASKTEYFLANSSVVDGTIEVYYDDILTHGNKLNNGSDYTLVHNGATQTDSIVFITTPTLGRTLVANYQYRPSFSGDRVQTGNAFRQKIVFTLDKFNLNGEVITKDPEFSPMNVYNDMRDQEITGAMSYQFNKQISIFSNYDTYTDKYDFNSDKNDEYKEISGGLTYRGDTIRELTYKRTQADEQDSLPVGQHKKDNTKDIDKLTLNVNLIKNDKLILNTTFEDSEFNDETGDLSDRSIERRHYGIEANPSQKLNLKTYFETTSVASDAPASFGALADFNITTYSKNLLINYYPNEIWALSGDMMLQARTDSRPDFKNDFQDTAKFTLASNPFGRFTHVNATLYRRDIPDEITGGTRSDQMSFDFGWKLAPRWSAVPSFNKTVNKTGNTSRNDTDTKGINFIFNADNIGRWAGNFRLQDNTRKNSTETTSSTSSDNQYLLNVDYHMSENVEMFWKFDFKDSSSGAQNTLLSYNINYLFSEKLLAGLNINSNKAKSGSSTTRRDYYILNVDYTINDTFSLSAEFERQNYTGADPATDYNGFISTLEFTAKF